MLCEDVKRKESPENEGRGSRKDKILDKEVKISGDRVARTCACRAGSLGSDSRLRRTHCNYFF